MASGARMPTWKERENNMRRERRRRAIAAKIYAGLRMYGNYKLPKHCDINEVLKAVCNEAGWTVEEDGTTYREGCKPMDMMARGYTSASPYSSYQQSPCASSYDQSPASSSFPSPIRTTNCNYPAPAPAAAVNGHNVDSSIFPWLNNLPSSSPALSSPSNNSKFHHHIFGSISAPVTPPLSSPTWTPPSWFGPSSPTFTLVARNPFGGSGSRMWTPGQSGTCSPAIPAGVDHHHHRNNKTSAADAPMSDSIATEFAFGCNVMGQVKPWKGERIHEEELECAPPDDDDLKLTLGNSNTR